MCIHHCVSYAIMYIRVFFCLHTCTLLASKHLISHSLPSFTVDNSPSENPTILSTPATSSTGASNTPSTNSPGTGGNKGGDSGSMVGVLAGGVVGALVVAALVVGVIILILALWLRQRRKEEPKAAQHFTGIENPTFNGNQCHKVSCITGA